MTAEIEQRRAAAIVIRAADRLAARLELRTEPEPITRARARLREDRR